MNTITEPKVVQQFPSNPLKDLLRIPVKGTQVVGKALAIVPVLLDSWENDADKQVYIPLVHVKEIQSDHIVCSRLIAESRGLA